MAKDNISIHKAKVKLHVGKSNRNRIIGRRGDREERTTVDSNPGRR